MGLRVWTFHPAGKDRGQRTTVDIPYTKIDCQLRWIEPMFSLLFCSKTKGPCDRLLQDPFERTIGSIPHRAQCVIAMDWCMKMLVRWCQYIIHSSFCCWCYVLSHSTSTLIRCKLRAFFILLRFLTFFSTDIYRYPKISILKWRCHSFV